MCLHHRSGLGKCAVVQASDVVANHGPNVTRGGHPKK